MSDLTTSLALADEYTVVDAEWEIVEDVPAKHIPVNGPVWTYRDYQMRSFTAVDAAYAAGKRRILVVQATGTGKTVLFCKVAGDVIRAGGKVLMLAHSDKLLDQAADKLERSTGLKSAKEKASHRATIFDSFVAASVQTLSRPARLQGWAPDHFELIIIDEGHRVMAKSYLAILAHFTGRALVVTATPDRGDKKDLFEVLDKCEPRGPAFEFTLLDAVLGGWLVRPKAKTIPLEINLKGVKNSRTSAGSDFDLTEVSHRIEPFLVEIAKHIAIETADRAQGMIFLPSVATARAMADALIAAGVSAVAIAGEDEDQAEKLRDYESGKYKVLCNAMLYTEGYDNDRVDWIVCLRVTQIRGLYVQMIGRGTRPLMEIIAALNAATTPEERRAIIANSAKPDLLILDFLWLTEKLNLVTPQIAIAPNARVAKQMEGVKTDGDLVELEAEAERDLLASLEKAAAAHKHKKGRMIDPLELAVTLNDETLKTYEPKERWEFKAPTQPQLDVIIKNGIDPSKVTTLGLASKVIDTITQRRELGLCTLRQMNFLERIGVKDAATTSFSEASRIMQRKRESWDFAGAQKLAIRSIQGIRRATDDRDLLDHLHGISEAFKKYPASVPSDWFPIATMLQFHLNSSVRLAVVPLMHPSSGAATDNVQDCNY